MRLRHSGLGTLRAEKLWKSSQRKGGRDSQATILLRKVWKYPAQPKAWILEPLPVEQGRLACCSWAPTLRHKFNQDRSWTHITELNCSVTRSVVRMEIPTCSRLSHRQHLLPGERSGSCLQPGGPPAPSPRLLPELSAQLANRLIIPIWGKQNMSASGKRPGSLARSLLRSAPSNDLPA